MRRQTVPLLALALALSLTGCSGGGDGEPRSAQGTGEPTTSQSRAAGSAGDETFDPDEVLVQQTLESPTGNGDSVQVGITSLEVQDRVLRLELAVTPDLGSQSDSKEISLFDLNEYFRFPSLLDRANLKRYDIVRAGASNPFSSNEAETKTVNGRPMRAYYYFAAPEDDIDVIDVVLSDGYPAFTDVPISR